jgi:plasmid stabilization system protein ParE
MSPPVVYLPQAEDDIDAAWAAYERRLAGLGNQYLVELRNQVDRIQANPKMYGVLYRDVRAAPLRRFPYVVYYQVKPGHVLVIAVQHGRRSSRTWQGRA